MASSRSSGSPIAEAKDVNDKPFIEELEDADDLQITDSNDKDVHEHKTPLKLDPRGMPLVPQPTDDPNDPLNWSRGKKLSILIIMSTVAFFGSFALAVMNPAYAQVGLALGKTAVQASYIGTISVAGAGAGCFLWSPLANVYGRRPVLLFAQTMAVAAGFGSSFAKTYGGLLVGRLFAGIGHGATFVLTAVVMGDVFCLHERGEMIGIATVALINGPHVASLPGGYVASFISWRWTLILPSITAAACLLLLFVGYPETLYVRNTKHVPAGRDSFLGERRLWGFKDPSRRLKLIDFARPLQMTKYPPIIAVALYSGVAFTLGSVMPAQTVSALFRTFYQWDSAHTGVALSISTTVGGVLGEVIAGPVTDRLMFMARRRSGGHVKPEARLHAMWPGFFLLPAGLVIFGCMIRFHDLRLSWLGACFAMGMTCFAVQVITTPAIAYVVDCYKPQAAQTVQLLNFTRQTMGFTVGFWSIPFGERVGFQFSGLTYALVTFLFFIPVLLTMKYGERVRARMGKPNFDAGI